MTIDESGRTVSGGPEGEKYPKTTRTGKVTKKQKRSLEESCESLIEEREERDSNCRNDRPIKPDMIDQRRRGFVSFCRTSCSRWPFVMA